MIKAVIFDIDGVLLDSFEANLKFIQDLMTSFGYAPPTREEFPAIFHLSLWETIKRLTGLTDEEKIRKIWEIRKNQKIKCPLELLRTPAGMEEVIAALSKDYLLGIVTSRIKEGIYEAPQLLKMQRYFSVTVSFEDTVEHKPGPEPLLLAAQKLGIRPEEAVYIGDVADDIKAARAAGMKIIIYSPKELPGADKLTAAFEKLPELIKTL
jgi:pyrophosphatase PpaX